MLGLSNERKFLRFLKFVPWFRRPIPIRELRDYPELARLTSVSPWTELVVLSPDGKSMELNGDITKEDAQLLLNSYAENTSICSDP